MTFIKKIKNLLFKIQYVCTFLLVGSSLNIYAQLDCSNAPVITINKTVQGNTTNSKNNNSKYNNDNFWQNTGPEDVYKLEWSGGTVTIKLSNKTAALDLIILRSCDPNNYATVSYTHLDVYKRQK